MTHPRVCIVVLDGVGIGAAPDAEAFGDGGSDTLGHILERKSDCRIPNLLALGLGALLDSHRAPSAGPTGAYGKMQEQSAGKDTTLGHWEIAGLVTREPFPVFPRGFPGELIERFEQRIGRRCLGNKPASGTEILNELGPAHQATGSPIVYTSADSVFQIAAHEETIPIEELYRICRIAREVLVGAWRVARVIARPFLGSPGRYVRTDRRRDFSVRPFGRTVLDSVRDSGREVVGIGKIEDIFAGEGVTRSLHTHDNEDGMRRTLQELERSFCGILFVNLVDFDTKFGHRRDPQGFAAALEAFDRRVPALLGALHAEDTLILTADHGNDPTFRGTDHTRELVPLLAFGRGIPSGMDLGVRPTFADVAASVAELLGVERPAQGQSFAVVPGHPVKPSLIGRKRSGRRACSVGNTTPREHKIQYLPYFSTFAGSLVWNVLRVYRSAYGLWCRCERHRPARWVPNVLRGSSPMKRLKRFPEATPCRQ